MTASPRNCARLERRVGRARRAHARAAAARRSRAGGRAASRACRRRRRASAAETGPGARASVPSGSSSATVRTRARRGGSSSTRSSASRGAGPPSSAATIGSIAATSSGGRAPRNASVTCSVSGATGAPDRGVRGGADRGERVADVGAGGRARRTSLQRPLRSAAAARGACAARPWSCGRGRRRARPGSRTVRSSASSAAATRDADRADGLLLAAAARPGDAGDADPDVGLQPRARARRQARSRPPARRHRGASISSAGTPASAVLASLE